MSNYYHLCALNGKGVEDKYPKTHVALSGMTH